MVACEKPDLPITKKILDYIKKENKVTLEVFATSRDDIDLVLQNYDHNSSFQVEPLHEDVAEKKETTTKVAEDINASYESKPSMIYSLSSLLFRPTVPSLTVDSLTPKSYAIDGGDNDVDEIGFQNVPKKHIIINKVPDAKENEKPVSLIGKIKKDYLNKLPKEFIQKYRLVVFGENSKGELMLASDDLYAELPQKAIDFIKNQHPVELFSTSKNDIEYAINIYE
jgi:hypothetical protein